MDSNSIAYREPTVWNERMAGGAILGALASFGAIVAGGLILAAFAPTGLILVPATFILGAAAICTLVGAMIGGYRGKAEMQTEKDLAFANAKLGYQCKPCTAKAPVVTKKPIPIPEQQQADTKPTEINVEINNRQQAVSESSSKDNSQQADLRHADIRSKLQLVTPESLPKEIPQQLDPKFVEMLRQKQLAKQSVASNTP